MNLQNRFIRLHANLIKFDNLSIYLQAYGLKWLLIKHTLLNKVVTTTANLKLLKLSWPFILKQLVPAHE